MPPKKYQDFLESAPHARLAKQHPKDERHVRNYVSITCPHCSAAFVEIAVDNQERSARRVGSEARCLKRGPAACAAEPARSTGGTHHARTRPCRRSTAQLEAAQKAIRDLNQDHRAARNLRDCFSEYKQHPVEARAFLRDVAKATHPDKHGGSGCVEGKLATGLQAALNAVRQTLPQ